MSAPSPHPDADSAAIWWRTAQNPTPAPPPSAGATQVLPDELAWAMTPAAPAHSAQAPSTTAQLPSVPHPTAAVPGSGPLNLPTDGPADRPAATDPLPQRWATRPAPPRASLPEQARGRQSRRARQQRKRTGRALLAHPVTVPLLAGAATAVAGGLTWRFASSDKKKAGTPNESGLGDIGDGVAGGKVPPPTPVATKLDPEHLIQRITFGATAALRAEVASAGAAAWLGQQLSPGSVADPNGAKISAAFPRLGWSIEQTKSIPDDKMYEFQLEVPLAHLSRAIWSTRQLQEVMVDFWSNHLNITVPGKGGHSRHHYDRTVIRQHALGNFADMLLASATHPTMLDYLDAARSTKQAPNENYARELLELHTVGVNGGYSERDIKQAALLLTGWEVTENFTATWNTSRHYNKPVTVMGVRYRNGNGRTGERMTRELVTWLAHHEKTAQHLARKLAIRFVSDDPPQALVDRLAKVYQQNRTAITPVLRELFGSREFAEAGNVKLRRPAERYYATVRALGMPLLTDHETLDHLYYSLANVGNNPMDWPRPDGYPDKATSWQSPAAALQQLNDVIGLVHAWNKKLGLREPKEFLPKAPRSRTGVIEAVSRKLTGLPPTREEHSAITTILNSAKVPTRFGAGSYEQSQTIALAEITILNSPRFLTR